MPSSLPPLIYDQLTGRWLEATPENVKLVNLNQPSPPDVSPEIQKEANAKREQQTGWQNFISGLKSEPLALKQGVQALVGYTPTPEEQRAVAIDQALPGFPAGAGRLLSSIPPAVLGGWVTKGIGTVLGEMIPPLSPLGGPIATNMAAGAGYEALKAQDNRGEAAALGALGGALGPTVLKAAGGVRNVHPEAQRLLAEGVPLTPGHVAAGPVAGPVIRFAEQAAEAMPIAGPVLRGQQLQALRGWDKSILKRVAPEPARITEAGRKGIQQVQVQFDRGYQQVMNQAPDMIDLTPAITTIQSKTARLLPKLSPDARDALNANVKRLEDYRINGVPKEDIKRLKNEYWTLGDNQYGKDFQLHNAYKGIAKEIDGALQHALPQDAADELKRLDGLRARFYAIERAHTYQGALTEDVMTPPQFMRALAADAGKSGRSDLAAGQRWSQPEAIAANDIFSRSIPRMGPGTAEKLMTGGLMATAYYDPKLAAIMAGLGAGLGAGAYALRPMMTGQSWITPYARSLYDASQRYAPGALAMPGVAWTENWK